MSAEKHTSTPGPWLAAAGPSSVIGWPVVAQTGRLICSIATPPKEINRMGKAAAEYDAFIAECEANARLIAAAPDMLATLKQVAAWLRGGDYDTRGGLIEMDRLAGVCEAAIAKAREA